MATASSPSASILARPCVLRLRTAGKFGDGRLARFDMYADTLLIHRAMRSVTVA